MGSLTGRHHLFARIIFSFILVTFLTGSIFPPGVSYAQLAPSASLGLPPVGVMLSPAPLFTPALVKGITLHPDNPLQFDFIIDTGDAKLVNEDLSQEARKLIKYFLASLTVPEDQLWVNLSPYEKGRVISEGFGQTEMGRDMLAQDYILKQLMSSLMYPENELGKNFWQRVYEKAQALYGTTNIPLNTFNKVWIVPEQAIVVEDGESAYIVKNHLKVMLQEDYTALTHYKESAVEGRVLTKDEEKISGVSAEVIRNILIPEIEREVNEGEHFANLRQIFNSLILAAWYKVRLKESLLGKVYVGKNKTRGIDTEDKQVKEKIYEQYIQAFQKGVYDYIKEEYEPASQKIIPRHYFSGGVDPRLQYKEDSAMISDGQGRTKILPALIFAGIGLMTIGPTQAAVLNPTGGSTFNVSAQFAEVGPAVTNETLRELKDYQFAQADTGESDEVRFKGGTVLRVGDRVEIAVGDLLVDTEIWKKGVVKEIKEVGQDNFGNRKKSITIQVNGDPNVSVTVVDRLNPLPDSLRVLLGETDMAMTAEELSQKESEQALRQIAEKGISFEQPPVVARLLNVEMRRTDVPLNIFYKYPKRNAAAEAFNALYGVKGPEYKNFPIEVDGILSKIWYRTFGYFHHQQPSSYPEEDFVKLMEDRAKHSIVFMINPQKIPKFSKELIYISEEELKENEKKGIAGAVSEAKFSGINSDKLSAILVPQALSSMAKELFPYTQIIELESIHASLPLVSPGHRKGGKKKSTQFTVPDFHGGLSKYMDEHAEEPIVFYAMPLPAPSDYTTVTFSPSLQEYTQIAQTKVLGIHLQQIIQDVIEQFPSLSGRLIENNQIPPGITLNIAGQTLERDQGYDFYYVFKYRHYWHPAMTLELIDVRGTVAELIPFKIELNDINEIIKNKPGQLKQNSKEMSALSDKVAVLRSKVEGYLEHEKLELQNTAQEILNGIAAVDGKIDKLKELAGQKRQRRNEARRERRKQQREEVLVKERVADLTQTMLDQYKTRLEDDLEYAAQVTDEPMISSIRLRSGLGLQQRMDMSLSQEISVMLEHDGLVKVDEQTVFSNPKRLVNALNMLIPHETGHHLFVSKQGLKYAVIKGDLLTEDLGSLNSNIVEGIAEEVMVDKIGWELANNVYTHDEDELKSVSPAERAVIGFREFLSIIQELVEKDLKDKLSLKEIVVAHYARFEAQLRERAKLENLAKWHEEFNTSAQQIHEFVSTYLPQDLTINNYENLVKAYQHLYVTTKIELKPKILDFAQSIDRAMGASEASLEIMQNIKINVNQMAFDDKILERIKAINDGMEKLAVEFNITLESVETSRQERLATDGGFERGIILKRVLSPEGKVLSEPNKLVRDKTLEKIEKNSNKAESIEVSGLDFKLALLEKLKEEFGYLEKVFQKEPQTNKLIHELAAVSEVLNSIQKIIQTPTDAGQTAEAKNDPLGGINFNPALFDLQIKRDSSGIPLPLTQQPLDQINVEGFLPIIINIQPIDNLPMLLGLDTKPSNKLDQSSVMN